MKKIIVTGCAGFIGYHLTNKLLDDGYKVVGIDNLKNQTKVGLLRINRLGLIKGNRDTFHHSLRFIAKDICDPSLWLDNELEGTDVLIHLAARAGVRESLKNPNDYVMTNIIGFNNVIEFCASKNIKLLYASSSSVYGKLNAQKFSEEALGLQQESPYAATKWFNEQMARIYWNTRQFSSLGMRFFTVYGEYGRPDMAPMLFADNIHQGKAIKIFNHGKQFRDFTYVGDIVEMIMLLMLEKNAGPNVLNLGRGKPTHLMDFISLIEENLLNKVDYIFLPEQEGDVAITSSDMTKTLSVINKSHFIDVEQGIQIFIEWYRREYLESV